MSFGLRDYPMSEFELLAEELLMSDSVIKVIQIYKSYYRISGPLFVTCVCFGKMWSAYYWKLIACLI